jgi:hypothetical protein
MPYVNFEFNHGPGGTRIKIAPEDILALAAGIVAIALAIAMINGSLPINKYTVGLIGFTGSGAAIARITKARKNALGRTPWIEWLLIAVLIIGFGMYVWATRAWLFALFK